MFILLNKSKKNYESKSLSYTHFKKKIVEKTQKFPKLRDFYLLSRKFDLYFLSFFINNRIFWTLQKMLLDHMFVEIRVKNFRIWIFAPKIIFILKTAPSSG